MTNSHTTNEVMHSLVEVTRNSDIGLLNLSICHALFHILDAKKVSLYTFYYNAKEIECVISNEVDKSNSKNVSDSGSLELFDYKAVDGLVDCLKKNSAVISKENKSNHTVFYPISNKSNKVAAIFEIIAPSGKTGLDMSFYANYLQVYKNYLNLLIDSELDTLTGLLNRRTFDKDLKKIISDKRRKPDEKGKKGAHPMRRTQKIGNTHWLAIIDIDFFKRVNDEFGHLYGDEVLLLLANIMRETFRSIDILFRFGGEEFIVILRDISLEGANNALERFRKNVESFAFPQVGQVTVSIGFVEITHHPIPTEVLGFADEALYYSKEHGRNQLNQYEALIADNLLQKRDFPGDDVEIF